MQVKHLATDIDRFSLAIEAHWPCPSLGKKCVTGELPCPTLDLQLMGNH